MKDESPQMTQDSVDVKTEKDSFEIKEVEEAIEKDTSSAEKSNEETKFSETEVEIEPILKSDIEDDKSKSDKKSPIVDEKMSIEAVAEAETSPEKTKDEDSQTAESEKDVIKSCEETKIEDESKAPSTEVQVLPDNSEKDKLVAAFERLLSESSVADEDISPKDVDTTRSLDTKDKQGPSIIQEQS